MLKDLVYLFCATLVCTLLSWWLTAMDLLPSQYWPFSLTFFFALFLVFGLLTAFNRGKAHFTGMLFVFTSIKLLLGFAAIALASVFLAGPHFLPLAIHFLAHYVLFTVAEIAYLQHLNKQIAQQHDQQ